MNVYKHCGRDPSSLSKIANEAIIRYHCAPDMKGWSTKWGNQVSQNVDCSFYGFIWEQQLIRVIGRNYKILDLEPHLYESGTLPISCIYFGHLFWHQNTCLRKWVSNSFHLKILRKKCIYKKPEKSRNFLLLDISTSWMKNKGVIEREK